MKSYTCHLYEKKNNKNIKDWRFWIMLSYGSAHLEAKILKKITCFSKIYSDKRLVYSKKLYQN
jgi:hypothetical protein